MYQVGDIVYDDLTKTNQKVIGVEIKTGVCDGVAYHGQVIGYWLEHPWLGGGRHPWEVSDAVY